MGYGFSKFWAEIQILRKNGLLEQFFNLFRPWQREPTLSHGFSYRHGSVARIFMHIYRGPEAWQAFLCIFTQFRKLGKHFYSCLRRFRSVASISMSEVGGVTTTGKLFCLACLHARTQYSTVALAVLICPVCSHFHCFSCLIMYSVL